MSVRIGSTWSVRALCFTRHLEGNDADHGQTVAGVTVPDTKVAREATELVREPATGMVYRPRRVFWFGSLPGPRTEASASTLSCCIWGAMFHDLGLN